MSAEGPAKTHAAKVSLSRGAMERGNADQWWLAAGAAPAHIGRGATLKS
jgi:hypothetical protein